MTISALKSLDAIIGDTIADIERVYAAYRGGEAASGSGVMSGSGISSPRSRTPEPQHDWEARMDGGSLKSKTDLEDEIELENKNENENENENDGDTDRVHENEGEGEDANLGLGQKDGARARGIHDASSTCTATTTTTIPTTPTTTATITIPPAGHARTNAVSPAYAYVSPPPLPSAYTYIYIYMSADAAADAATATSLEVGVETPAKNAENKKEGDGKENGNGDGIFENPRIVTTECTPPGTGILHAVSTSTSRRVSPVSAPLTCEPTASLPQHVPVPVPPPAPPPPPPTSNPPSPPPPNPHTPDFPSLDNPYNPSSLSEALTAHPAVQAAICRIVAAAGQLAASVQVPFLTLCDAGLRYHLPSCMRLVEGSHVVEILREAGERGMHVDGISKRNGVQASNLAHVLRLLATHLILREISPDVFALDRISSMVDSGKSVEELRRFQENGGADLDTPTRLI
ncbi:O-methyltransferase [Psilocybe cubensis]|uniref:Uncharacterized protein n=2 Tax=Psilocybe cubensis TaxID=181762 RepID=A0A8H8CF98_PSICU|nr:O-methyltransferase [Psilocybe cubensis]KAH9476263.1 O-methyltransferase [Psilocybe cubensis]